MDPFDLRKWSGYVAANGSTTLPAIIDQITIDSRRIDSKHTLFIALEGKSSNGHHFIAQAAKSGAKYAIVKKGWKPLENLESLILLYVDDPLKALQQIASTYRKQQKCMVVGIAGSYGKTMVKDLLYSMLATTLSVVASPESFNSQIGVPLSLLTINKSHEIALIEAGISKNGEMDNLSEMIGADYGIVTHIGKKHIATLETLENTALETIKLLNFPKKKKWAILPENSHIQPHLESLAEECHFWNVDCLKKPHASFVTQGPGSQMPYHVNFPDGYIHRGEINCGFYYFLDLINITVKAAWLLGISSDAISETLSKYTLEPMRTEIWKSPTGATFVNDTYCSDPQSVDTALKYLQQSSLPNRKLFIFGGMRTPNQLHIENDYRRIAKAIHRARVDKLFLYGKHAFDPLINEIKFLAPSTIISTSDTYESALDAVKLDVRSNDIILVKGEQKQSLDSLIQTFNDSVCTNQCIINLAAIASNLAVIRSKLAFKARVMVMVKALAYGTDEVRMAKFLETCDIDILGVSYVEEGVALKRVGVQQAIFVINAALYEAAKVVKWDLEIGVSDKTLIKAVANEALRQNKIIKVHLHIDTGMSRFGTRPEEALALAQLIMDSPSLQLEGLMTHLASADDPIQDTFTLAQAKRFEDVITELKNHGIVAPWHHAVNSSGALRFGFPQFNMARIGLAVYGLHPSPATREAAELKLALSLTSRIVGINICKKGETISYGRTYSVVREQQNIAVLPIGYFDGLHRNYSGKSVVIIRGQKAPMVGKICMDFMMVDVSDIPHASPGDSALIFGEDEYGHYLSPEELATSGDSIIHELITCLGPRIQRIFVHEEGRFKY
ncbi:MAG: bifunctional UDP-N-acetylmuramoyl-tripeptide:D-alanyl-D-alanine ligase/alanine racemase [Parachlamydiaceae bacterium]|nr:bifunctional UDP-N-acetylmuramoyl-tripeptide:D-alanyl-D-alanine ligase/alanine racemase [Parachlamydiaceae bacterium]